MSFHQSQLKWTKAEDATFFDAIAEGFSISAAASIIGRTKNSGIGRWSRVRAAYGWQAS